MSEGYIWWRPLHAPEFDGWVQLVREQFETEDQGIDAEKRRMREIGRRQRRRLAARGVDVERINLRFECGIVYNPPEAGDERIWAIEYFKDRMIELAIDEDELVTRLLEHQSMVLAAKARAPAALSTATLHASGSAFPPTASPSPSAASLSAASSSCDADPMGNANLSPSDASSSTVLSHSPPAPAAPPSGEATPRLPPPLAAAAASSGAASYAAGVAHAVAPVEPTEAPMAPAVRPAQDELSWSAEQAPPEVASLSEAKQAALLPDEFLCERMERVGALERAGLWRLASEEMAAAMVLCKQHHDNQIRLAAGKLIARLLTEAIRR